MLNRASFMSESLVSMASRGARAGTIRLVIFLAAALFARPSAAGASDGFFCVGPDYLAYEFDDGAHTPVGHGGLYIVALGGPDGFAEPVIYELEPGRVRAMRCLGRRVQLLDGESIRTVDLDGPRAALSVRMERQPLASAGARPDGFVALNLGELSRLRDGTWPEDVALPGSSRFSYALAVIKSAGVPQNHMYECNPASVTRLHQFDTDRHLVRSLEIFAGCELTDDSVPTTRR
jgi:hypothetical protein